MKGEQELKRAWRAEVAALTVLVAGSFWVGYNRLFTAFSIVALIAFVFTFVGFVFSIQAVQTRRSMASVLALWGSLLLFLGTFFVGFLGFAAGV